MLVSHAGVEMDRADLIHRVWEKHGFSGSSVSLNVSVSEIRKAFRELGHDPGLISTLRKKGFCLQAQVERQHAVNEPAPDGDAPSASADIGTSGHEPEPVVAMTTAARVAWSVLAVLLLCLLLFFLSRWHAGDNGTSGDVIDARPVLVGAYGQCSLFVLTTEEPHATDYPPLIQQQLAHEQIDCHKNKADVYFTLTRKHLFNKTFMGVCYFQPDKTLYSRCVSYRRLEDLHDD